MSTIGTNGVTPSYSSANLSTANLSAAALMGAVMSGQDYGFVKDVQEKISDVTQQTRNAQANVRSAQQKAEALQAQVTKSAGENGRKSSNAEKSSKKADNSDVQAQLAAAKQAVSDAKQVVKNLQAQLADLVGRALPAAQAREATARQQDDQRADQQRSQSNATHAEQEMAKELSRTLNDALSTSKAQTPGKGEKGEAMPQSGIVDRTAEFTDVKEGQENYNDAFLAGTAEQSPQAYANTKKSAAAGTAAGAQGPDDGLEQGLQQGQKGGTPRQAGPAGSGLPETEGLSAAAVAKLLRQTGPGAAPAAKLATSSPAVLTTARAGTAMTSAAQLNVAAPRPTGGGTLGGTGGSTSGASNSASASGGASSGASSAAGSTTAGGASRSSSSPILGDSSFTLPEAGTFAAQGGVTGRRGSDAGSQMTGGQDSSSELRGNTTMDLGGVSMAIPKAVAKAATTPPLAAAGQALVSSTQQNPAPMKDFLRASQPDGRTNQQLVQDTVQGFGRMVEALGLGGDGPRAGTTADGSAAAGNLPNVINYPAGPNAGPGGQASAPSATPGRRPGASTLASGAAPDAATTAILAANVSASQGGADAAPTAGPTGGGAGRRDRTAAGAAAGTSNAAVQASATGVPSTAATSAAQTAKAASGSVGLGSASRLRGGVAESGATRAVVLGTARRKQADELDPFDLSEADTGGLSQEAYANLSPMQRVMTLMVSAANDAQAQATDAAGKLTDHAELTAGLQQRQAEFAQAIRAQGGEPGTGATEEAQVQDPRALVTARVSDDLGQNQATHRAITRALATSHNTSSSLLAQLQGATQLVSSFAQGASNVAHAGTHQDVLGVGH